MQFCRWNCEKSIKVCTFHERWQECCTPLLLWRPRTDPWHWEWGGILASGSPEPPQWSAVRLRTKHHVITLLQHLPFTAGVYILTYRHLRQLHRESEQTGALKDKSLVLAIPRSPWSSHLTCRSTDVEKQTSLSESLLYMFCVHHSWRCM